MTRRRTTLLGVVDRVVVVLVALAMLAAGVAILAAALGFLEPPDLAGMADTALQRLEEWPAIAVIVVGAVVAILGAAFAVRHLLPASQPSTVSQLTLPSPEGRHHTGVKGRALSKAVEADLGRLWSVRSSSARLVSSEPPAIEAKVSAALLCDLDELRAHVSEVAERLEGALGRSDVRLRVRIGFGAASKSRVE